MWNEGIGSQRSLTGKLLATWELFAIIQTIKRWKRKEMYMTKVDVHDKSRSITSLNLNSWTQVELSLRKKERVKKKKKKRRISGGEKPEPSCLNYNYKYCYNWNYIMNEINKVAVNLKQSERSLLTFHAAILRTTVKRAKSTMNLLSRFPFSCYFRLSSPDGPRGWHARQSLVAQTNRSSLFAPNLAFKLDARVARRPLRIEALNSISPLQLMLSLPVSRCCSFFSTVNRSQPQYPVVASDRGVGWKANKREKELSFGDRVEWGLTVTQA